MARIKKPADRAVHIQACKRQDQEWNQEHGGKLPPEQHYENVGDIAATNNWLYHDPGIGYHRFYANTPDWIVEIAVRKGWISDRGELRLCENCWNEDGTHCFVCCPEAYSGGAV
jgi:hypothetical protein